MKLWVDDLRTPPGHIPFTDEHDEIPGTEWAWTRSSPPAIRWLARHKTNHTIPEAISLDHDLGGDDTTRPIILWMCEHDFWPQHVYVHTANPVGREWLEGMIDRYKP